MTKLTMRERIFGRTEDRSLSAENVPPVMLASPGGNITPITALKVADVYAAVRLLADSVSSLPLHVYRKTVDGRQRVDGGSLVDLLDHPAPGTTQADLVATLMSHVLIHGDAFLGKYKHGGVVDQLGLLPPDRVQVEVRAGRPLYTYTSPDGKRQALTTSDLVHVKSLSVDGIVGLSAVSQASRVLGLSDELVKHALAYFEQDKVRPAGVLKMPVDASEEARTRMIESLRAESVRTSPGMQTLVVEGEGEYEAIAGKLDDTQFVEQRRLAAQEVARVFRIPPHMLGAPTGDSLTYATVEQQSLDFVRFSLLPWTRRIELAISGDRDLTSERQFVRFELDGLLRPDSAGRAAFYKAALDPLSGWATRAEIRALEDLPPEPFEPDISANLANAIKATNGTGDGERISTQNGAMDD
jgi:HK97 family phage portal protein